MRTREVDLLNRIVAAIALLTLSAAGAVAQTAGSGTITGTVSDPAGAVVPGVSVVVQNTGTSEVRSLTTNGAGIYTATFLQPGSYQITVSKPGFAKIQRTGLTLEVGRTLSIDLALTVQTGAETITVTGEAPVVDTDKTDFSEEISQDLVSNLPIIGRRWDNFALATPGATADGGLVSFRGISGLYNNNSVDGANNNQAFFSEARGRSTVPYTYSIDAIQEFQVSASNYSAEFGQAAGGVVNAVTKSGTNELHGDLFYFLRYPTLNALDPINKANKIFTQSTHQFQQFGGVVGGAIIKDKLFYFLNYDGSRKVFPIAYTSTSNFPLPCPAGVTGAQCTAANAYLSSLVGAYPRTGVNDLGFGKLDYLMNSRNRLSANFDLDDYHAPNSYNSSATVSNNSITANGPQITHTRFFIANWDSTITPNMINNLRFQWGVDEEIAGQNAPGPSVTIASVMAYGMPNALPRPAFPLEHRLQLADTLSWSHGKHQIKAGYDFNIIHEVLINLFQGGGIYSYSGAAQTAFNNWVLDTYGINTGDGLTGKHYSSFVQVTDPITGVGKDDFYDKDYAGFVEDSWKVRPNLTLNLGVRYEIQTIPQPPRPNTSTPLNAYLTSYINTDSNNFGPRIGIAWEPMKDTVVRLGYGMFYAKTTNSTFYTLRVENGVYQQTYSCSPVSTATNYCPTLTFPNVIYPPPGPTPIAPFAGALTPQVTPFTPPAAGQLSRGLPHDFVNPLVHEGDLTIEHQLPGNVSISGAWLFSRGLHLPAFVDANLAPATTTHTYAVLNAANAVTQTVTLPWYTQRIDPGTGDILTGYSVVNSWYNALALTLRRPMTHGFEALINYTFSKSTDDGAVNGANGTFNGTDYTVDPKNQKAENSVSDLYQKHKFTGSIVYAPQMFHQLPNKAAKAILDGWLFSSTISIGSPLPVFALISGFPTGLDYGLTGGTVTNTGGSTGGRPPQVGRNNYFGATQLRDVDLRIMREFPVVRERVRFQIIGEAFNLFNHSNISSVNGTAFNFVSSSATSASCPSALYNGCLSPNPTFLLPTSGSSTNGLVAARQLQISAKVVF
ncbi:MAG TPA: TonB-dependent receptor [Bryobacteraceae bacterium]